MKKLRWIIFLLSLFSCSKEPSSTSLLDTIPIFKYYNNEIFSADNMKLYGKWQFSYIYADAGIIAGPGKIDPNYDFHWRLKGMEFMERSKTTASLNRERLL